MPIIIRANLDAKRVGTYEGREFVVLQFVERDERNALKLIEVNLPDGTNHAPYVEGKPVELAISVSSSKTGKVYYRAILAPPKPSAS